MAVLAVGSVKHGPGATTAALALAAAAGAGALVVEADPAGGDLAARAGLGPEPGLVGLAAAARRADAALDPAAHAQVLGPSLVVVAPAAPELAAAAVAAAAPRLPGALAGRTAFVDCGRLFAGSPALAAAAGADLAVVVAEPTAAGVEHLRARAGALGTLGPPLAVLLVGDRPHRPAEVAAALGLPVLGALALDPRGVAALLAGRAARRSALVRSARSALERAAAVAPAATGARR